MAAKKKDSNTNAESSADNEALGEVADAMNQAAGCSASADHADESRGWLSKSVYATCYYASFGVMIPTYAVVSVLPTQNALGFGFLDGARAAGDSVELLKQRRAERQARKEAAREARRESRAIIDEGVEALASA